MKTVIAVLALIVVGVTSRKKIFIAVLACLFCAWMASAHTANLSWTLSLDDTTTNCTSVTCSQTVYRAPGACLGSSAFVVLDSNLAPTAVSYTDTTIVPGTWCYAISFTENGIESAKATATVILQPTSQTGFTVNAT